MTSFQHNRHSSASLLAGQSSTFARIGIGVRDADQLLEVAGVVHISGEQAETPAAPADADGGLLYTKADGKPYWRSNEVAETDLSTGASTEAIQDIVGAMFTGNTETRIAATYEDGDGTIDLVVTDMTADTQLTQEQVEDFAGAMVASGGTKTGITVTYQDGTGDMDFVVSDLTVTSDSGSTAMTPGDTLTIAGGTNISTAMSGDTLTINQSGGGEANEYSFRTIAVSGQDNVVAETTTDTLTFAAAGGITLTTTAASDTVTISSADTNTQLTTEQVQDIVGGMLTGNTETRISVTYEDGDGTIDFAVDDMTANTQLTQEQVEDYAGALVASGGTKTGLSLIHI